MFSRIGARLNAMRAKLNLNTLSSQQCRRMPLADFPELRKFSMKLRSSKDPAHDFTHIERMIKLCKAIAPPETDINLVMQAAYLHGSELGQESIRVKVRNL
jgi:hypothetical protein